jgi:trans-aconitate 2-methyltransferase
VIGSPDWDAATYDRAADPQEEWGRDLLERLELSGDETVLDAGCGSGRLTRLLAERVPRGRVIGVDGSAAMIERARRNLADLGDRIELIHADLLALELSEAVDAVFSNATFHWILDHDRLFSRLFEALRPGGVLEADCGGEGNVAELERCLEALQGDERFVSYLRGFHKTWDFPSVGDTESRLRRAGFGHVRSWLERRTISPREPREWLQGVTAHLGLLPPELREQFLDAVIGTMPRPFVLEFVRLNISARRPE